MSDPASSTAELLARVRSCTLCETALPHGVRPVLQLHSEARILIAGQAPGRRVHESGVPFDDPSGDRLRDWLGIDHATFYDERCVAILPLGFCYPGTGASGDLPPRPECAPAWREALLEHLPGVELTVVLGRYALDWHLPRDPRAASTRTVRPTPTAPRTVTALVRDWRRHWPDLLPLPHPSPRNRAWFRRNPWFEDEVIPELRTRVSRLLGRPGSPAAR